jgi:hypothetical protein
VLRPPFPCRAFVIILAKPAPKTIVTAGCETKNYCYHNPASNITLMVQLQKRNEHGSWWEKHLFPPKVNDPFLGPAVVSTIVTMVANFILGYKN